MWGKLLRDSRFFSFLFEVDRDLATAARKGDCPRCGGRLHSAPYPRKPRGASERICAQNDRRFSFCCDREGCRRRTTPPSVRFLGPKVYFGVVFVLVAAMRHGPSHVRAEKVEELVGVGRRTLVRWREWWKRTFATSPFWRRGRARFSPPVGEAKLPWSILARFGGDAGSRLVSVLRFLAPVSTASAPAL